MAARIPCPHPTICKVAGGTHQEGSRAAFLCPHLGAAAKAAGGTKTHSLAPVTPISAAQVAHVDLAVALDRPGLGRLRDSYGYELAYDDAEEFARETVVAVKEVPGTSGWTVNAHGGEPGNAVGYVIREAGGGQVFPDPSSLPKSVRIVGSEDDVLVYISSDEEELRNFAEGWAHGASFRLRSIAGGAEDSAPQRPAGGNLLRSPVGSPLRST